MAGWGLVGGNAEALGRQSSRNGGGKNWSSVQITERVGTAGSASSGRGALHQGRLPRRFTRPLRAY